MNLALAIALYLAIGGWVGVSMATAVWDHLVDRGARRRCVRLSVNLGLMWPSALVLGLIVSHPVGDDWFQDYLNGDHTDGD